MLLLIFLLGGVLLSASNISTAFAASPHPFKLLGSHGLGPAHKNSGADGPACDGCGTPPLLAKGGPVVQNPHVYLDFWGSWWLSSAESSSGIVPALQTLFSELAGSQYNNILTQYTHNGSSPNDTVWAGTSYDNTPPPNAVSMVDIGQEAANAIASSHWPNSPDTLVLVFPQPGTTYGVDFLGDCGKHGYGSAYGLNNPYVTFGMVLYDSCGSTVSSMQKIAAHEYAEMVTDPEVNYATAWSTSDGQEIGDLCEFGPDRKSVV